MSPTPKQIFDLQLTPDFGLREFAVSAEQPDTAATMRFTELEATKLFYLCSFVLQPLRDLVGQPIEILSGKRTPELNQAVGGSKTSQHVLCEAADFVVKPPTDVGAGSPRPGQTQGSTGEPRGVAPTLKNLQDVFEFVARTWPHIYHQIIIYYTDDGKPRFIHVSLPPSPVPSPNGRGRGEGYIKRKGAFYHHKGQYYKLALERSEGVELK